MFPLKRTMDIAHLEICKIYKTNMKQNHMIKEISKQPNGCYNVQLPTPSVRKRMMFSIPLFKLYAFEAIKCRKDEVGFA